MQFKGVFILFESFPFFQIVGSLVGVKRGSVKKTSSTFNKFSVVKCHPFSFFMRPHGGRHCAKKEERVGGGKGGGRKLLDKNKKEVAN